MEVPEIVVADDSEVKRALVAMAKRGPAPMEFWTIKMMDQWGQDERNKIPGTPKQRRDVLRELIEEGVFKQKLRDYTPESGGTRQAMAADLDDTRAAELGYL